jgi:hypothetical protein
VDRTVPLCGQRRRRSRRPEGILRSEEAPQNREEGPHYVPLCGTFIQFAESEAGPVSDADGTNYVGGGGSAWLKWDVQT